MTGCQHKVCYPSQGSAHTALVHALQRGTASGLRAYRCGKHGGWHLTSANEVEAATREQLRVRVAT